MLGVGEKGCFGWRVERVQVLLRVEPLLSMCLMLGGRCCSRVCGR